MKTYKHSRKYWLKYPERKVAYDAFKKKAKEDRLSQMQLEARSRHQVGHDGVAGICDTCGCKIEPHYLPEWGDHCLECAEENAEWLFEDQIDEDERSYKEILAKHALRQQGWPNEHIVPKILETKKIILETKRKIKNHDYQSTNA